MDRAAKGELKSGNHEGHEVSRRNSGLDGFLAAADERLDHPCAIFNGFHVALFPPIIEAFSSRYKTGIKVCRHYGDVAFILAPPPSFFRSGPLAYYWRRLEGHREERPWFILAVMLFSYLRAFTSNEQHNVRGGVYRVVKEAWAGPAKFSVSALSSTVRLVPISAVVADSLAGFIEDVAISGAAVRPLP